LFEFRKKLCALFAGGKPDVGEAKRQRLGEVSNWNGRHPYGRRTAGDNENDKGSKPGSCAQRQPTGVEQKAARHGVPVAQPFAGKH